MLSIQPVGKTNKLRMIAVMQTSVCPFLQLEKPEDDLIQYCGELLISARLSVPAQSQSFQFEGIKCFGIHECLTVALNDLRGLLHQK